MSKILFYIKDLEDQSIWSITKIDYEKNHGRLGWLSGVCVAIGTNSGIYVGCDIGIDSQHVFESKYWDISKKLETLINP